MQFVELQNPAGIGGHCHSATIAARGKELWVCWYGYPEDETEDARIVLAKRTALGHWQRPYPLFGDLSSSTGNPVIFVDPESGDLELLFVVLKGRHWVDAVLHRSTSRDGRSWSPPGQVFPDRGLMVRHAPIAVGSSTILVPAYDERKNESLMLIRNGSDWRRGHAFAGVPTIQPVLMRESRLRLTLLFRPVTDPRRVWRCHSSNNGATWSAPVRTLLPCSLSGVAGFALGNKQLAAVYNHTEEHARYPLSVATTMDGGIRWSDPVHLDTEKRELSYPAFIRDDDGAIHGVYTFDRRKIKYVTIDERELPRPA